MLLTPWLPSAANLLRNSFLVILVSIPKILAGNFAKSEISKHLTFPALESCSKQFSKFDFRLTKRAAFRFCIMKKYFPTLFSDVSSNPIF